VSVGGVIFIDANQYLDLYRLAQSQELLPGLAEQREHILVISQVVDEVQRQKVKATRDFLASIVKKSVPNKTFIPSCRIEKEVSVRIQERLQEIHRKLSHDLLEQVSRSKDEVSMALASVFSQAIVHTNEELQRAKARKERGNPPGKRGDPLGDELSWEQLLSHCKDKPRLWIISKDSDYATVCADKMFLNAFLYQDLTSIYQSEPTVFCFNNIGEGLRHFVDTTGAKAVNLPTLEETEQIKREQESLPPIGWLVNDDSGHLALQLQIQDMWRRAASTQLSAPWMSRVFLDETIPPPETRKPNEGDT
jgi:hypothetical protein